MPHLHLPLQSGSDRILRLMARRTRRKPFRRLVQAARQAIPHLNVSTDIICGFPGETEEAFQESLDFVREIGFSRLHVFTYSPRPGTAAADMPGQLPKQERKARTRRMIALGEELSLGYHKAYEGEEREVLWEATVGGDDGGLRWIGYTDNYMRVTANGPDDLFNRVTLTRLVEAHTTSLRGTVLVGESKRET
jgi:threonylcarbamoyladenosine tRNA methylthiotransferase MtaB